MAMPCRTGKCRQGIDGNRARSQGVALLAWVIQLVAGLIDPLRRGERLAAGSPGRLEQGIT